MDKKRPGGEFGKRLKDRFIERENNEVGKGDGGKDSNLIFSIPPKNRFMSHTAGGESDPGSLGIDMQSFFNFQGTAVKPVCECGTYIHDRPYWIGHQGPLCYSCWLKGDKT